jgi:hypothetical protein
LLTTKLRKQANRSIVPHAAAAWRTQRHSCWSRASWRENTFDSPAKYADSKHIGDTTEHRIGGFMVNMAMVVMAAAAFHDGLHNGVAEIETASGETDHDKTDHCR